MYVHILLDNGPTGPKHADNCSLFLNFSVLVCGFNYEELIQIHGDMQHYENKLTLLTCLLNLRIHSHSD